MKLIVSFREFSTHKKAEQSRHLLRRDSSRHVNKEKINDTDCAKNPVTLD